ncbi:MAG: hypothetical protein WD989_00075 [Candidatus Paceibacterota bacterium]
MSILEKIHEQPQHIREIMFGLSVITTVSLVGAIWFKDFRGDMYALLNPEEVEQERFLAQSNSESLFATLGKTFGDMSSILTNFWGSADPSSKAEVGIENKTENKVYLLPLSEEK